MIQATARLAYLDSLRGLAATSVVWHHFVLSYEIPGGLPHTLVSSPLGILLDGPAAVAFFFVLSGFVLSLKCFRDAESPTGARGYRDYAISRLGRIWLPYVAVVLLSVWLKNVASADTLTTPASTEWGKSFWQNETQFRHLLLEMNLFVKPTLFTLVPQAWTLFVEMTMSLLIPAAVFVAVRDVRQLALVTLLAVAALGVPVYALHFMFGLALAQRFHHGRAQAASRAWWVTALLASAAVILYGSRSVQAWLAPGFMSDAAIAALTGAGAVLVLHLTLRSFRLQQSLATPFLVYLGRVSYSIYLIHFVILLCVTRRFVALLNAWGIVEPALVWTAALIATTLATWLVAGILYWAIEAPSMTLARNINMRVRTQLSGAADRQPAAEHAVASTAGV